MDWGCLIRCVQASRLSFTMCSAWYEARLFRFGEQSLKEQYLVVYTYSYTQSYSVEFQQDIQIKLIGIIHTASLLFLKVYEERERDLKLKVDSVLLWFLKNKRKFIWVGCCYPWNFFISVTVCCST